MTLSEIKSKVNFKQPKYVLPAILYPLLLGAGWLIFDLFDTELAEAPSSLQTTEYLNPNLPDAQLRTEEIGSKYQNMVEAYGQIQDFSAVESIEQNEEEILEEYDSKYTDADLALLDEEAARRLKEMEAALEASRLQGLDLGEETYKPLSEEERMEQMRQNHEAAMEEMRMALAEARLKVQAQSEVSNVIEETDVAEPKDGVTEISDDEEAFMATKPMRPNSSYFHTLAENEPEPRLIKAIIDEDIKAVEGSRVRLRLLDDVEIGGNLLSKGTYLYATMSGFGSQRVKGTIKSLMVGDELVKVSLTMYDTDGLEGLYIPQSSFRETSQEVVAGALSNNVNISNGNYGNSFSQWGMQAIQNAYQQTAGALSKAVKKNKAHLKYGTFVYLVNSRDAGN